MQVIYIDYLFVLNIVINYLILLLTAKICAAPFKRLRFFASAALGAAYAAALVFPSFGFLAAWPMKIALSIFMVIISFGAERRLLRTAVVFYAVSAAFGGAVIGASMIMGASLTDALYVQVPMSVLAPVFVICYAAVTVVFRRSGLRPERSLAKTEITLFDRSVKLSALRDTGNNLRDPVSGSPVMVAETGALLELFPEEIAEVIRTRAEPARLFEAVIGVESARGRFRLVPYTAVGIRSSLLLAFRPDEITLDGDRRRDVIVALSPTKMCDDNEYSAVI